MNTFPLIKAKWSNEHTMAVLFLVLVLYHLPLWSEHPAKVFEFILLIGFGLLIDCVAGMIRYKRLWCCVSGAVTAAMISLLTDGVPIWGRLLGIAAALILGKHIWGGTGKNLLNPAMVGLLVVLVFYEIPYPAFTPSYLLIPALILSLFFLRVRPFAGIGFIIGMLAAFFFYHSLTLENIMAYGVLFWGCLVMTDPVTVTPHPIAGAAAGFLAGFATLYYFPIPVSAITGILAVNLFSDTIDSMLIKKVPLKARFKIPKLYLHKPMDFQDLTDEKETAEQEADPDKLSPEEILNRIRGQEVFGMGGAGFQTFQKLMTLKAAGKTENYLIINGVECDPGLIHDKWLLHNKFDEIVKGVEVLKSCIGFKAVYLAVKDTVGLTPVPDIQLQKVKDRYPAGAEKILIHEVMDKSLSKDQIPAAEGILVLNVQTIYTISEAVLLNKPVNTRYLTVADLKKHSAKVVKVKLGMKLQEIMNAVYPGAGTIFAGGGILQSWLAEEDSVVDRTVNFIATGSFPAFKESPQCSKCGACTRNCPSRLKVKEIVDLVDQGKLTETLRYHADECISCGSCSYSCMAGRNLSAKVKRAKEAIRQEELLTQSKDK